MAAGIRLSAACFGVIATVLMSCSSGNKVPTNPSSVSGPHRPRSRRRRRLAAQADDRAWTGAERARVARRGAPGQRRPRQHPLNLSHSIGITATKPSPPLVPQTMTETIASVTVQKRKPIEISLPLSGPNWVDGDGCCDMGAHRMAVNPLNGDLYAAERFAIDYVQIAPDGKLFNGDRSKPESYPYYGADIHAVANGPVVAVVDGLAEQVPGVKPAGLALDQYGGNHFVPDIGGGNYAFYAHLKTQSIKVKPVAQQFHRHR
jgi:hypothetical protein